MRVVGRKTLARFCLRHADARNWVVAWLAETESGSWDTPQTIKDRYSSASFVGSNTVIFNVKGNAYRLEVQVAYRAGVVVVNWIGTHAAYDRRNAKP